MLLFQPCCCCAACVASPVLGLRGIPQLFGPCCCSCWKQVCGTNCEVCRAASRASARRLSDMVGTQQQQQQPATVPGAASPLPLVQPRLQQMPHAPSVTASDSSEGLEGSAAEGLRSRSPPPGPPSPAAAGFLHSSTTAPLRHAEDWVEVEGEFVSIM